MNSSKLKLPFFTALNRTIVMGVCLAIIVLLLSLYNNYQLRNSRNIEAVDSLSGQRIAVGTGWEADYLLTPRKDITLLRYDTNAECILGLAYGQVDAIAVDSITMNTLLHKTKGLERIPGTIARIGSTFYASYGAEDKLAQFNEYAAKFIGSPEGEEFAKRLEADEFVMADIPEIEDGEVIHIGYLPESYPEAYIDTTTGEPAGYGIEMLKRFAYEYGYTIEWHEVSEAGAYVELERNKLDFAACYLSDTYKEETELGGLLHMTDAYHYDDVLLMKLKDGEKLEIVGELVY